MSRPPFNDQTLRLARFWFDELETATERGDWELARVSHRFLQVQLTGVQEYLEAMP